MVHRGISLARDCVQCSLPFDSPISDTQKTQTVVIYNTRNDRAKDGSLTPHLRHKNTGKSSLVFSSVPLPHVKNTVRKPYLTLCCFLRVGERQLQGIRNI